MGIFFKKGIHNHIDLFLDYFYLFFIDLLESLFFVTRFQIILDIWDGMIIRTTSISVLWRTLQWLVTLNIDFSHTTEIRITHFPLDTLLSDHSGC